MSVRVNLLPSETAERQRAVRQRGLAGLAGVLLLVLLGAAYFWQLGRVSDAEEELAAEQAVVSELEAEVANLSEFADLRSRREESNEVIQQLMADEATVAGVLQDLAAVMPTDTQVDSFSVTLDGNGADVAEGRATIGTFELSGKTLDSHAPGVERLLIALNKLPSFFDLHVSSSNLEEGEEETSDVANFSIDGLVGPELLTGRYAEGLPEELR